MYSHLGMDQISAPTLVDRVADTLKNSILEGKFSSGERLYEAALAREFGISRGPIREALALLEGDGIVENTPRRGKFVTRLDTRTIDEIYSLRRVLEPYAAELLIERNNDEAAQTIRGLAEDLNEAVEAGDSSAIAHTDIAFHAGIYLLADHRPLSRTWNDIISNKLKMLINVTTLTHELADPVENHENIVDAICVRDRELARDLIVEHIDDAWHRAKTALGDREAGEPLTS